jgi:hypothetical protein
MLVMFNMNILTAQKVEIPVFVRDAWSVGILHVHDKVPMTLCACSPNITIPNDEPRQTNSDSVRSSADGSR